MSILVEHFLPLPLPCLPVKGLEKAKMRVAHLKGEFLCVGTGSGDSKCYVHKTLE